MYVYIHIHVCVYICMSAYISSGDQVLFSHAQLPAGCVVHLTAAWPVCNCMESCNGIGAY